MITALKLSRCLIHLIENVESRYLLQKNGLLFKFLTDAMRKGQSRLLLKLKMPAHEHQNTPVLVEDKWLK